MSVQSVSIRLMRGGVSVGQAIRKGSGFRQRPAEGAVLYSKQPKPQPPDWLPVVNDFALEPLKMSNATSGAILFLSGMAKLPAAGGATKNQQFTCAITFGTGHFGLDPDAFERSFGLRVVLNAVPRDRLSAIDTATLDATTILKRVQTSRLSDLQIFGMDQNRDLLRLASGKPGNQEFASSLAGKDALSVRKSMTAAELLECCKRAVILFHDDHYKRDFGFIDHVSEVKNKALISQLDDVVFDELKALVAGKGKDLHLAIPDVFSPEETWDIGYLGTGLKAAKPLKAYPEISIEDYVAELRAGNFKRISKFEAIKATHEVVRVKDGEADKAQHSKLYKCFVLETVLNGHAYVLFDGQWFEVAKKFQADVEAEFKALLKPAFVTSTTAATERKFIEELDKTKPELLNMDQVKLSPEGAAGANLEPCDFFSKSRELIHLKDGHSSSSISHLWNQAVVSCEAFVRDGRYRDELIKNVKTRETKHKRTGFAGLLPAATDAVEAKNFKVIFGIMREPYVRDGRIDLPFFSKVSVRTIAARLQTMSFPVEVHLIEKRHSSTADGSS